MSKTRHGRLQGRQTFSKAFKDNLYVLSNGKCSICNGFFEERYLQVDHRVPYEVAGDTYAELNLDDFMLVCGPCNRAKSWSCEHCANWQTAKLPEICLNCYWAKPENYIHVALREIRRTDILWNEDEVEAYEKLKKLAAENEFQIPDYVKKVIKKHLDDKK